MPLELHAPGRNRSSNLMESDLLRYLTRNRERIVSRKELLEQVWHVREDTDTRAIDNSSCGSAATSKRTPHRQSTSRPCAALVTASCPIPTSMSPRRHCRIYQLRGKSCGN